MGGGNSTVRRSSMAELFWRAMSCQTSRRTRTVWSSRFRMTAARRGRSIGFRSTLAKGAHDARASGPRRLGTRRHSGDQHRAEQSGLEHGSRTRQRNWRESAGRGAGHAGRLVRIQAHAGATDVRRVGCSFRPFTGGRDDRQAHAFALGRHTVVCSSPVAGGARCVRHQAERAAPRAGAGVPRAYSCVRIGLGPVLPLARSGGLRPTCVLDRPERLEIHWSGVLDGLRGGDVAGRFRLAGWTRRYCDGGHGTLDRRARRGGRWVSFEQDVPRLESLWDRRLRRRRLPRHAVPLARIHGWDEHSADAAPPVRVDPVFLRAVGSDGALHAARTTAAGGDEVGDKGMTNRKDAIVLVGIGERSISSSLAAILVATMPLLVALLPIRLSSTDTPSGLRLLGLVIGLAGVVALLGIDVAGRADELWGAALVLLATLGY